MNRARRQRVLRRSWRSALRFSHEGLSRAARREIRVGTQSGDARARERVFETLDKLKPHRSRVPLHRGSLLAFFGGAATLAAFWAVCDRVAWVLSSTAFVTCFDAATRFGASRVPI